MNLKLKTAILEKGLTQRQVAIKAGIGESQLSNLIRLNQGGDELRDKVSHFLSVPKQQLFE